MKQVPRFLRGWLETVWRALKPYIDAILDRFGWGPSGNIHTTVTFRAVVDAVIPETPALEADLGPEHVPGGLAVDLEDFVVTYVDDGFQLGLPHAGPAGNIPLANPIADVLDHAADQLVRLGLNESEPRADRAISLLEPGESSPEEVARVAGTFSKLSREDRLRAINLLDDFQLQFDAEAADMFEVDAGSEDLFEFDAGLVGQLVIGYTEMIYYSEWEGYDEYTQPPSHRVHANDPADVQSWRQTDYPGFADGYAALRGYLGTADSPLGDGERWATVDPDATPPVEIRLEPGSFRENEYDTSGYEEPYPE